MAVYPPTRETLKSRIAAHQYMARRNPAELDLAIENARGDIEAACPAAADGTLSAALDRLANGVCLDLASWYIRADIERDENGAMPRALVQLRDLIDRRIKMLAEAANSATSDILFEAFEPLDAVAFPAEGSAGGAFMTDTGDD